MGFRWSASFYICLVHLTRFRMVAHFALFLNSKSILACMSDSSHIHVNFRVMDGVDVDGKRLKILYDWGGLNPILPSLFLVINFIINFHIIYIKTFYWQSAPDKTIQNGGKCKHALFWLNCRRRYGISKSNYLEAREETCSHLTYLNLN